MKPRLSIILVLCLSLSVGGCGCQNFGRITRSGMTDALEQYRSADEGQLIYDIGSTNYNNPDIQFEEQKAVTDTATSNVTYRIIIEVPKESIRVTRQTGSES